MLNQCFIARPTLEHVEPMLGLWLKLFYMKIMFQREGLQSQKPAIKWFALIIRGNDFVRNADERWLAKVLCNVGEKDAMVIRNATYANG